MDFNVKLVVRSEEWMYILSYTNVHFFHNQHTHTKGTGILDSWCNRVAPSTISCSHELTAEDPNPNRATSKHFPFCKDSQVTLHSSKA
jgi:hypothetical protein